MCNFLTLIHKSLYGFSLLQSAARGRTAVRFVPGLRRCAAAIGLLSDDPYASRTNAVSSWT